MGAEMLCQSVMVELRCPDGEEYAAIAAEAGEGRPWASGYPTDGDVLLASLRGPLTLHTAEPWGLLQIVERCTGEVVGGAGFMSAPVDGCVELGYGLAEGARHRGLATEAVKLLLAVAASHGLQRVTARTEPGNLASQAVLRRAGFTAEMLPDAQPDDELCWSIPIR